MTGFDIAMRILGAVSMGAALWLGAAGGVHADDRFIVFPGPDAIDDSLGRRSGLGVRALGRVGGHPAREQPSEGPVGPLCEDLDPQPDSEHHQQDREDSGHLDGSSLADRLYGLSGGGGRSMSGSALSAPGSAYPSISRASLSTWLEVNPNSRARSP